MSLFSKYYYQDLNHFFKNIIPIDSSSLKVFPETELETIKNKYEYLLLVNSLAYIDDIQSYISNIKNNCYSESRVVVVYYNFLWKPFLDFASLIGLRKKEPKEPNWLSSEDIQNLFLLEGFEQVKKGKRFLFPLNLNLVSKLINQFIAQLPLINYFCLTTYQVFRMTQKPKGYSISIVIPARNEKENIKGILNKIPKLGNRTEVIFIEGHSRDNTYEILNQEVKDYRGELSVSLYRQLNQGKGDAVRQGFKKAKNDILMILDADLTVPPSDLKKFYNALAQGYTEFANGSRLVYPMEKDAMRILNYLGNKIFGTLFSYLLGQRVKDTLCGTKALFAKDYKKIEKNRKFFGNFDPFGDFDLLFGASKLNLRILDIPVRYRERKYGKTNISRFKHGWLLLKMSFLAAKKIKFI